MSTLDIYYYFPLQCAKDTGEVSDVKKKRGKTGIWAIVLRQLKKTTTTEVYGLNRNINIIFI